jgi:AbrB family looped-hinge helix DNA binding protein
MSKANIYRLKVTSKRQVTFPKQVMDALHLKPGDTLELRESTSGYALALPQIDESKLFTLQQKISSTSLALDLETFRESGYDPSLRD